jgi:hypothetical protein
LAWNDWSINDWSIRAGRVATIADFSADRGGTVRSENKDL